MDLFIDKLAQKLVSAEAGKANAARNNVVTDTKEIEYLKAKIEGYEDLLQDMRMINLRNIESAEKLSAAVMECTKATSAVSAAADEAMFAAHAANEAVDAVNAANEAKNMENEAEEENNTCDEIVEKTSDVIHRENVKVYRNVQKAFESGLEDHTKALLEAQNESNKKNSQTFLKVMSVLIFVAVLADIALKVLGILGIF